MRSPLGTRAPVRYREEIRKSLPSRSSESSPEIRESARSPRQSMMESGEPWLTEPAVSAGGQEVRTYRQMRDRSGQDHRFERPVEKRSSKQNEESHIPLAELRQ